LGLYGVFAVAEEAANAQALLDLFEEQLDPPTASVEVGDGARVGVSKLLVRKKSVLPLSGSR